jgi:hypothetical protein
MRKPQTVRKTQCWPICEVLALVCISDFVGVITYPEDQVRILAMPAVTPVVGEEAPGKLVVLILHENAHAASLARFIAHILLPNDGQEQRTSRVHDRDVGKEPVAVVLLQHLDCAEEEGVLRDGAHGVV